MIPKIFTPILMICFLISHEFAFSRSDLLKELRSELRYKFALDFVVQHGLNQDLHNDDSTLIFMSHSSDPNVLEAFQCYESYLLYRSSSFDRKERYFVLIKHMLGHETWFLLADDSTHPILLDSTDFQWVTKDFQFDTLNGGDVIKAEFLTTGSGFFGHHFVLLTIKNGKFIQQFHCYLSYLNAMTDTTRRGLGKVTYTHINEDGYLDIVLESREDMLDRNKDVNVWKEGEIEYVEAIKNLSTTLEKYTWNKTTLIFTKSK